MQVCVSPFLVGMERNEGRGVFPNGSERFLDDSSDPRTLLRFRPLFRRHEVPAFVDNRSKRPVGVFDRSGVAERLCSDQFLEGDVESLLFTDKRDRCAGSEWDSLFAFLG